MRILIVKLSSLGDLFHALPTVRALKTQLHASIDWVVRDVYRELVCCFDDVDRVIPFYRTGTIGRLPGFVRVLRRQRYDLIIDLQGLLKSAVVARLARGKQRIGPSFHREGSRLFYDRTATAPPVSGPRHAVEACLDVLASLDLTRPGTCVFPVTFPTCRMNLPRPWIAIAPASRWTSKNWPPERFAAVAADLQKQRGGSVILVGDAKDRSLCDTIARHVNGPVEVCAGRMNLVETGGLLQAADVLIANDSGPSHVAAAAGTPCVVIFGPTDPDRTGPYGPRHQVLKESPDCAPCMRPRCRHQSEIPCLERVQTEQVVRAAEAALDALSP